MASGSTGRVPLSRHAKNWLWSESGGHCQNPACRVDLHDFVEATSIAELAHIIPASAAGPRAAEGPDLTRTQRALPENVLVLCPTCHTVIDKAPAQFPAGLLRRWKRESQQARAIAHGTPVFASRAEGREYVEPLLAANRTVFDLYGPVAGLFDDARADQWRRHVRDVILPNNRIIVRVLQVNRGLLTEPEKTTAHVFALHVQQLEERHLEGNWTPGSTGFPADMTSILKAGT